jgi:hypothetical protein
MNRTQETTAIQTIPKGVPDPATPDSLSTSDAAALLGLKRQQFQVLIRFLDIKPAYSGKARPNSRSESYFYASEDLRLLTEFLEACRKEGGTTVLKRIFSAPGTWGG